MSDFLGRNLNLALGVGATLLWLLVVGWYLHLSGYYRQWRDHRARPRNDPGF